MGSHNRDESTRKTFTPKEIVDLYSAFPGQWFLLRVLERDKESGKGTKFQLIRKDPDKEKLYELLEEEDWDWEGEYMFVYADPDAACKV